LEQVTNGALRYKIECNGFDAVRLRFTANNANETLQAVQSSS
jgi:hypothetical protein